MGDRDTHRSEHPSDASPEPREPPEGDFHQKAILITHSTHHH